MSSTKRALQIVKTLNPAPGKTVAHVEFTRDGSKALVSIWEDDGAVIVYDATTLEELKRLPMRKPSGKIQCLEQDPFRRRHLPLTGAGRSGSSARCFIPSSAGAVAINLFLLGLMWQAVGIPALSPVLCVILSVPLGIPGKLGRRALGAAPDR